MTFRQNEIFLKQYVFCPQLMPVLTILIAGVMEATLWPMLFCCALCGVCCIHSWRTEPTIFMDEQGVRCTEGNTLLWDLPWSQIAEVRKITRYRSRAVLLIPTTEPKQVLHIPQNHLFFGFQLSRSAKNALKTYCPGMKDD